MNTWKLTVDKIRLFSGFKVSMNSFNFEDVRLPRTTYRQIHSCCNCIPGIGDINYQSLRGYHYGNNY